MLDELRTSASALLAAHRERARACGVRSEAVLAEGEPIETILRAARKHAASLVVIGTHGRRGLRRFIIGSVAEGVVRRSALPVAVVRASPERPRA